MKTLLLILTMAVFHPLTAQAEAVFDEAGTFQIAKAVRLGRDATVSTVKKNTAKAGANKAGTKGSSMNQGCFKTHYENNGVCTICPSNAQCNGTSQWWCMTDYWQNANSKSCVSCNTTTTKCPGKTEYRCKDKSGNVNTTWSVNNRYKDSGKSDPNKCTDCPNLQECNGTNRQCFGKNRGTWNTDSAHALNSALTSCEACNGNDVIYECNGTQNRYCYGKNTAGSSFDNKYAWASNSGSTTCQRCPTRTKCNGTQTYQCNTNAWRDNSKSDPNKCQDCPANATCTGGTEYTCKSAYWRNASEQCVTCPANATCDGSKTYNCITDGKYWRDNSQSDPYKCVACPAHGICNGSTTFTCEPGYFVKDKTCASVAENTVCKTGFTAKVARDNNNTVYCVQP